MKKRLDQALENKDWLSWFGGEAVETLILGRSDHLLVLLRLWDSERFSQKQHHHFKFEAKWLLEADGEKIVTDTWKNSTSVRLDWNLLLTNLSSCSREFTRSALMRRQDNTKQLQEKVALLRSMQSHVGHIDVEAVRKQDHKIALLNA